MTDPAAPLSISTTDSGIAVAGEIDAHTAPALAAAIGAAADVEPFVIDLFDVEFIDSSGLRVLLEARQTRDGEGRTLTIARPSKAVARLFGVAGVAEYLGLAEASDT